MRILLITDEIWNDRVFGNNVLQNWFEGMKDVEFAQICATPGRPYNSVCKDYFQLTDSMILKSLVGKRAGHRFQISPDEMRKNPQVKNYIATSPFYSFMKRISGEGLRLVRELLWMSGRINRNELKSFIDDFNPDIIFCPRKLSWKLMRIEKIVSGLTDVPMVAFTADDEASFREYSWSPIFWINRYFFHRAFGKHINLYKKYFTFSSDQKSEYEEEYGIKTGLMYKCGDFAPAFSSKYSGNPIRLVYAGRLYCNRWKTLAQIGEALDIINRDGVNMVLDIYTQEKLDAKQSAALGRHASIAIKGSVTPEELKQVYRKADIALHVESLEKRYKLATRTSFSTKIVDLMASTCAILVISWDQHTGYKYLKENDAAFCLSAYEEILPTLQNIVDNPSLVGEYASKAHACGLRNHNRMDVQKYIYSEFTRLSQK